MFFLPFKMDSRKSGLPFLTVLVCLICIGVYWEQFTRDRAYYQAIKHYCYQDIEKDVLTALRLVRHEQFGNYCEAVFEEIRDAERPALKMKSLAEQAENTGLFANREDNVAYVFLRLTEGYNEFTRRVPRLLTRDLSYDPRSPDVWKMFTATFSHGDFMHLAGNLLFFYIFAASVELVIGHFVFAAFILVSTVATSLAYSYATMSVDNAMPTVGLSGVVMAMVAALALMLPHARINCLLWIGIIVKIIPIPAIFLAVWYIGWDIYDMRRFGQLSGINYVAHISGAILGSILGLYYTVFEKRRVREATVHY